MNYISFTEPYFIASTGQKHALQTSKSSLKRYAATETHRMYLCIDEYDRQKRRGLVPNDEFKTKQQCRYYLRRGWNAVNSREISGAQNHDDVINWDYFPRYWPFVRGIHRSPVVSSHKVQWREAYIFSLICAWINGWANNRDAGVLWRHHAHYVLSVMISINVWAGPPM